MIDKINFNPNIVKHNIKEKDSAPVIQPSFEGNCEMPTDISNAYRAYGQAILSSKPAKIIKTPDGKQIFENNRLSRQFIENENGSIQEIINYYYNDEIPQANLTLDGFTHYTSPREYIKYLQENQIKYEIKKENKTNRISVTEYSDNGEIQTTEWSAIGNPTRHILNSKGQEVQTMTFEKGKTIVEDYCQRQKIRNIDVKQVSQEKFTPEGITYSTTPKNYITYLKQNNIPFRINRGADFFKIVEYDQKGEETQTTKWTTVKGEFVPIRTYSDKQDNITENIVFFKDTTQLEYPEFERIEQ